MGHLINPISNRISINTFWNSNWVLVNNFNYNNIFKKDYILFQFLNWFIKKSKFSKFNVIISHYKIFKVDKNVVINFYYYDASWEEKKYKYTLFFIHKLLKKKRKLRIIKSRKKIKDNNNIFRRLQLRKTRLGKIIARRYIYKSKIYIKRLKSKKINNLYSHLVKLMIANLYWYILNKSLKFYLKKLNKNKENFYFNIFNLNFLNITTDIISTYISLKLQQKYSLNWVLRPVLKDLTIKLKKKIFLGFKIVCAGRFTRKQIATYSWSKQGSVKLNTFKNLIKYSESTVRLKYGLCGIKVWINYGNNKQELFKRTLILIYPHYTPFRYIYNIKNNSLTLYLNYWFFLYIRISYFKSKFYNLYKYFVKIKIKILIKYLLNKIIIKNFVKFKNNFSINLIKDNRIYIKLINKEFIQNKKYENRFKINNSDKQLLI